MKSFQFGQRRKTAPKLKSGAMITKIYTQSARDPHLYLREWRKYRHLTQEQVADRLDTTKSTISRYENGVREPDEATKAALAYAYDCDVPDLYGLPEPSEAARSLRKKSPKEQARVWAIVEAILKAS